MMEENKSHAEKYDFQHGYTSGLESVDKNNYEGYLSSQVNFEWLDKQLQEQKHELNKLEEKSLKQSQLTNQLLMRFKIEY
jgi:hypothetical protein